MYIFCMIKLIPLNSVRIFLFIVIYKQAIRIINTQIMYNQNSKSLSNARVYYTISLLELLQFDTCLETVFYTLSIFCFFFLENKFFVLVNINFINNELTFTCPIYKEAIQFQSKQWTKLTIVLYQKIHRRYLSN